DEVSVDERVRSDRRHADGHRLTVARRRRHPPTRVVLPSLRQRNPFPASSADSAPRPQGPVSPFGSRLTSPNVGVTRVCAACVSTCPRVATSAILRDSQRKSWAMAALYFPHNIGAPHVLRASPADDERLAPMLVRAFEEDPIMSWAVPSNMARPNARKLYF